MEEQKQQIDERIVGEDEGAKQRSTHHHHHHHSHHSHHRSGSSRKKTSKVAAFFKRHRSVLINVASCTVSVILLVVLAVRTDVSRPTVPEDSYTEMTNQTVKVEVSVFPQKVALVSEAVQQYMTLDDSATVKEIYKSFEGHKSKLNTGLPLTVTYRVTGLPGGVSVDSAELLMSENKPNGDVRTYTLDQGKTGVDVYNLKTGTAYDYRVTLTLSNACVLKTEGRVEIEQTPRILHIDGAANVRDIGGWITTDGRTIRQGLLYRGSEIDGAVEPSYTLTENGRQQMLSELGIRFDMDLRAPSDNKNGVDPLGKNVIHKYYSMGMYADALTGNHNGHMRAVFMDLAQASHYPIYLHCTYGKDRTGTICYLLGALLGVSESDLKKEYELSAFTDSYVNTAEFKAFVEKLHSFAGASLQQKAERYLRSVGVTDEQITNIRTIFLEENA